MPLPIAQRTYNGEVVYIDSDLADKLKFGDPISGWSGDVNMILFFDNESDRFCVATLDEHGNEYPVIWSKPGVKTADMNILYMLASTDRNTGYDVAKDISEHNQKVQAEQDAAQKEKWDAAAEKLAWGLKKDIKQGNIKGV